MFFFLLFFFFLFIWSQTLSHTNTQHFNAFYTYPLFKMKPNGMIFLCWIDAFKLNVQLRNDFLIEIMGKPKKNNNKQKKILVALKWPRNCQMNEFQLMMMMRCGVGALFSLCNLKNNRASKEFVVLHNLTEGYAFVRFISVCFFVLLLFLSLLWTDFTHLQVAPSYRFSAPSSYLCDEITRSVCDSVLFYYCACFTIFGIIYFIPWYVYLSK